jgi:hypothetical protein
MNDKKTDRDILESWHSNPLWKLRVNKMTDEQVSIKLRQLYAAQEWRLLHGE